MFSPSPQILILLPPIKDHTKLKTYYAAIVFHISDSVGGRANGRMVTNNYLLFVTI